MKIQPHAAAAPDPTINTPVLIAIVIIAALDVVAGIIIPAVAPTQALPILASVFGFSLTIITLLFAVLRINAVGIAVDGKMNELLEMRSEIAALRATALEKADQAGREAGTALATAAASDTHTATTIRTTLDSPPTVVVPVAVAPPAAALPFDVPPPLPVTVPPPDAPTAEPVPGGDSGGPMPWGPPITPTSYGPPPPGMPDEGRHG